MQNTCNQNKYMVGRFTDFDLLTIHHLVNGSFIRVEEFPSKDIPMMKQKYEGEPSVIKGIEIMEAGIIFEKELHEKQKALTARTDKTLNIQSPTA